jgi:hypothetical protein
MAPARVTSAVIKATLEREGVGRSRTAKINLACINQELSMAKDSELLWLRNALVIELSRSPKRSI